MRTVTSKVPGLFYGSRTRLYYMVKISQAHTLQIPKFEGFVDNIKSLMMRKSTFGMRGALGCANA